MDNPDSAAAAYQNLTPHQVIASVESLGFLCDGRLLALNSYENRVYRVGLETAEPLVAKFYRPGRWSDAAILEEHDFSAQLAGNDIPVVAPLTLERLTLFHRDDFRFAIYPCHGGRRPDLDSMEILTQLGRLVARIQLCGEQRDFEHRPTLDSHSFGIESYDYLLDAEFIPGHLIEAYSSVCEMLFELIDDCYERAGRSRYLRIHGDFHPSNVLLTQDALHIVDLDDTRTGPAVQDLWMFLSGDRAEQTPQLDALLAGYSEFRRFDALELHLIEALRTLRLMHYAAWLARRWEDPAFPMAFPWFDTQRYWDEHVLMLREQAALMQEPPLVWQAM